MSTAFNQFTINSQIYSHFNDVLADNSITLLDDAALSQLVSALIPGSNVAKIETAFSFNTYDDIYSYLTSPGVNGPELLDLTGNDTQDIFIRLYAAIGSAPIESNSNSDGRRELMQSVLDLIQPTDPLPTDRLVDLLQSSYDQKVSQVQFLNLDPDANYSQDDWIELINLHVLLHLLPLRSN